MIRLGNTRSYGRMIRVCERVVLTMFACSSGSRAFSVAGMSAVTITTAVLVRGRAAEAILKPLHFPSFFSNILDYLAAKPVVGQTDMG